MVNVLRAVLMENRSISPNLSVYQVESRRTRFSVFNNDCEETGRVDMSTKAG